VLSSVSPRPELIALQLFDQLRTKANQKEVDKKTKELEARLLAQYTKQEKRMADIVRLNVFPYLVMSDMGIAQL